MKVLRKVFPTDTPAHAARSLVVMGALVAAALFLSASRFSGPDFQKLAAWFSAAGVILLALGEARSIGTVRVKGQTVPEETKQPPLNPPGTWLKLWGHALLVPGALFLVFSF